MIYLDYYAYFCLSMLALMVYRRWLDGTLPLGAKVLMLPLLVIFAVADVAANHLIFWVLGPKPYKTWTISQRFEAYRDVAYPTGFNKYVANITCTVINWFDRGHR